MKILIAFDGSTCADDAINDLPRAGLPRDAEALIVHVQERWLSPPSDDETLENVDETRADVGVEKLEILESATQRLGVFFPEWQIETSSLTGSPAREIIRRAREWKADIIVVGSQGSTETKRFVLGSISQKIVNEAGCSVRVVRGQSWKNGSPSRLLIGLDGTKSAMTAVEEVARRMWIMGSEVRLVVARDASKYDYKWVCEFCEDAKKVLQRAELTVTELIEEGDPKRIIAASAEEWGADCIFLGANDAPNSFENPLLGSVSTAVVARAHCTVEIVRDKADE